MAEASLTSFFKHTAFKTAGLVSKWILIGTEIFIPQKTFKQKPNSQGWLNTNLLQTYLNHYYNSYHSEWCSWTFAASRTAHNHCTVLENEKCSDDRAVYTKFESKQIGSRKFAKTSNQNSK